MSEALTLSAVTGAAIFVWVLYLYRKGRLKEDHALLWSAAALGIVLLSMWTDLLIAVNRFVGATSISDVVLAAFIAFLLVVSIYYSVKISDLTDQTRRIAQELALMKVTSSTASTMPTKELKQER